MVRAPPYLMLWENRPKCPDSQAIYARFAPKSLTGLKPFTGLKSRQAKAPCQAKILQIESLRQAKAPPD